MNYDLFRKNSQLGSTLKTLRERVGISQKELVDKLRADGSNMTIAWYSKIESRRGSYPSAADLEKILFHLGSDIDELNTALAPEEISEMQNISSSLNYLTSESPAPQQLASFDNNINNLNSSSFELLASLASDSSGDSVSWGSSESKTFDPIFQKLNKENQAAVLAYARVKLREQDSSE